MNLDPILAAGSVVWRINEIGEVELALIHRPTHKDWSFPKGKQEQGESSIACAYRETLEETGFDVRFHNFLGEVSYPTAEGTKLVKYWSAKFTKVLWPPDPAEVDRVQWFSADDARERLSHESDLRLLETFLNCDLDSRIFILLRHASAIKRDDWQGDDLDRPLSALGEQQSKLLISSITPFGIREIHSSSAVRCYQTINPIARALALDYFFTDSLTEYVFAKNEDRTFKYIDRLLDNDYPTLVCGHNPILPAYLSTKYSRQGFEVSRSELKPADAWVVHHIGKEIIAVDHLSSPTTA